MSDITYTFQDFIGFGIDVIGTDLEEGQQLFYDYRGVKEVTGVRDNHHLIIDFSVNKVTPKTYNARNINEFEANLIYGDLFTVYGIDIFFYHIMNDYREYDYEFGVILKKHAPILLSLYENRVLQRFNFRDIEEDLYSIFLDVIQKEYTKNDWENYALIPLDDIEFSMNEDNSKLVLNYDWDFPID